MGNGANDGLANGGADAAKATSDGMIPGTTSTISYLILASALLLIIGLIILAIAYKFDKKRKLAKMMEAERNITGGYASYGSPRGVAMVGPSSPSSKDGNLTLPSYDRPKQPSIAFVCADDEASAKKKKKRKRKNVMPANGD